jgi:hypothetical protein
VQTFRIQGGNKLNGDVVPQGAKNEALQIICATLLTPEEVVISNIPDIIDVNKLINLLSSIGVKVNKINPNKYSFKAEQIDLKSLSSEKFKTDGKSIRGSIMIVGPLLARFGIASIPRPSVLNFSELKDFKSICSALKLYLLGLILFTLTPIDERRLINLLTSIISGILLMTTSSGVKRVAHMICRASFLAP